MPPRGIVERQAKILTPLEKALFLIAATLSALLGGCAALRLMRIIARGSGRPQWRDVPKRALYAAFQTLTFEKVFHDRRLVSVFHGMVAWGFIYYLLVNLGDVLQGLVPDFVFLGSGHVGGIYRLGADLLSVGVLLGMAALLIRRLLLRPLELRVRASTLLDPSAREGMRRDSALVGGFILLHVGSRLLGESFHLAKQGADAWQPVASLLAVLWKGWPPSSLEAARHVSWWLAVGLILAFVPYFPMSKHIHLFFAPLNFLLHPHRRSMGELDTLDFEDESVEQFGVEYIEDLSWKGLMDAYACIMCNRCQDACPAYATGKVLSPAALEINKRYYLNQEGVRLTRGENTTLPLLEVAIPAEAVWACTACGACIQACPVGNEPMRDILEIRRHLVLMQNAFPEQLQTAFRGMERSGNPWNIGPEERLKWADGLPINLASEQEQVELLWWVGCAPATDPQAQRSARAFARILLSAGVKFAVLGPEERCTGDSARRSGNEYLFSELARANVRTLNRIRPDQIVTTCPHCLHTLKNEYPAFGGVYKVVHHTELLEALMRAGSLPLKRGDHPEEIAFHDPCFLGRQNGVFEAPRVALAALGRAPVELNRTRGKSFCCGAGGAQMWKEEEAGDQRVSHARLEEAYASGAGTLAVGCPFCMVMLSDAAREVGRSVVVQDVAEIVAARLEDDGDH